MIIVVHAARYPLAATSPASDVYVAPVGGGENQTPSPIFISNMRRRIRVKQARRRLLGVKQTRLLSTAPRPMSTMKVATTLRVVCKRLISVGGVSRRAPFPGAGRDDNRPPRAGGSFGDSSARTSSRMLHVCCMEPPTLIGDR